MAKNTWKAHIALLLAGLMFGANFWIAKELMPHPLLPKQIIFFRLSVSAALFWLLSWLTVREKVEREHLKKIALASMLGVSINQVFFFEGLNLCSPVDSAILQATSPIAVLIFAAWLIREKASWVNILGILLGSAGAIMLVLAEKGAIVSSNTLGKVFILVNTTSYAIYLVLIKPMMIRYHPLTVMKWVFLFGFAGAFPVIFPSMMNLSKEVMDTGILLSLAYVVLVTTMLAYLLTIFGLKYMKASSVGYYIYMQPFIAAVVGLVWFGEPLTLVKMMAAALIFFGVFLVNNKQVHRKKVSAHSE